MIKVRLLMGPSSTRTLWKKCTDEILPDMARKARPGWSLPLRWSAPIFYYENGEGFLVSDYNDFPDMRVRGMRIDELLGEKFPTVMWNKDECVISPVDDDDAKIEGLLLMYTYEYGYCPSFNLRHPDYKLVWGFAKRWTLGNVWYLPTSVLDLEVM